MHGSVQRGAMRRSPLLVRPLGIAVAGLVSVALTGCGSTGAPSGTVTNAASPSGKSPSQALKFAQCMRAHGVSNFPDPSGNGVQINRSIAQSPNFQSAQNACKHYLPNDGQPPVTAPGSRAAALAFAKCMRSHGVPNFPDPLTSAPSSPPAGAVAIISLRGMAFELGAGLDPRSPAFQQAASNCGIRLPRGNKTQVAP
jgi:hypothetical protein